MRDERSPPRRLGLSAEDGGGDLGAFEEVGFCLVGLGLRNSFIIAIRRTLSRNPDRCTNKRALSNAVNEKPRKEGLMRWLLALVEAFVGCRGDCRGRGSTSKADPISWLGCGRPLNVSVCVSRPSTAFANIAPRLLFPNNYY